MPTDPENLKSCLSWLSFLRFWDLRVNYNSSEVYLHVDVDSVDPGNAEVNPNGLSTDEEPVSSGLSRLRVDGVEELDQTPVLNDTLGHGNLKKILLISEHA